VGDDMPINGGGTIIPLDDIGDGASSYADDPPDSPVSGPPTSAPPSPPKAPAVEQGVIWISYTPSAQARHIGDNRGTRRERAIDIDLDPADSTDVDAITSAATALSLDDTVENHTEDLAAEAMGRVTLDPDLAPTPRGGGTRPCRAPLAACVCVCVCVCLAGAPPGWGPAIPMPAVRHNPRREGIPAHRKGLRALSRARPSQGARGNIRTGQPPTIPEFIL